MMRSTATNAPTGGQAHEQAQVIAFFSHPASYPAKPKRVERFETHGALVFPAGEGAWKIKRDVHFEWAVHMRRFDQAALLSQIADAGPIPSDLADALADAVFESHDAADGNEETLQNAHDALAFHGPGLDA